MLKNIKNFFSQLIIFATSLFSDQDIIMNSFIIPSYAIKFVVLIIIAFIFFFFLVKLIVPIIKKILKKTKPKFDDIFNEKKLIRRTLHIIPAAIISIGLPLIVNRELETYTLIIKGVRIYYILITLAIYDALLNSFRDIYNERTKSKKVGITGIIQALKVLGIIIAFILAISVLAGKSPIYFLSGLGAFTAVLMLIFRDPILGLVAGVQLSAMDLIRKGDWIEIPKHGADGQVVDITLTTVKVRNWDMTFTAIPAYELIAFSFKNWRGMFESGGRRIKRSMRVSMKSIHFLS
jgi:miniconductance mechanosensitive channel